MPSQYEQLGLAMESYIKSYVPKGFKGPIKQYFNSTPLINSTKAEELTQKFKSGSLEEDLREDIDPLIKDFKSMKEAIYSFFQEGKHKEFVE
jgi:hypothetical protein